MRVCKITNSPFENAEHLQVVKYDQSLKLDDEFQNKKKDSI